MKKIISLSIFIICIMINCSYAGIEVPETIRIGLYSGTRAVDSFKVSSKTGMEIGTINEEGEFDLIEEVKANKEVSIEKGDDANSVYIDGIGKIGDDENFVRIIPKGRGSDLLINVSAINYRGEIESYNYRGEIEARRFSTSDMTVINELPIQEYLYGVVPREIGGNSPIEAVKAQAIIARTYAIKNYNKREKWGFNLTNTTDDQAYGGYDWENPNSNGAVDETEGLYATYNGELIGGYYFSTSGGYTESSANVWGGEVDYLEAVPDPYEPQNLSKTTWSVTYSAEEIEEILNKKGVNIGKVLDVVINDFSDAGRVLELEIVGSKDSYIATKSQARTLLNLNSQWFTINDDEPEVPDYDYNDLINKRDEHKDNEEDEENGTKDDRNNDEIKPLLAKILNAIEEKNFLAFNDDEVKIDVQYTANKNKKSATIFEIKGRGWGHSVGMSQNGAIGMANNDFSCEEIIKWYYRGVEIEG